jgi:hypothetical protein
VPPQPARPDHLKRLAWLLACFFTGLAAALAGSELAGNDYWYLAIPAAIAAGWLFLANPAECVPAPRKRNGGTPGHDAAP